MMGLLKPLRLPRAWSPGMGVGGDWWSRLNGVIAEAQGIPGIAMV